MTDDILVFGKTREELQANLITVLKRLEENSFNLNKEKWEFYKSELTFFILRFVEQGISPTEDRVREIHEAKIGTKRRLSTPEFFVQYSFMIDVCIIAEPL